MKKILILCLVLSMLLSTLAACKKNTNDPATDTGATEAPTGEVELDTGDQEPETDEWGRPVLESSLPDDLNYNNETVTIVVRSSRKDRFLGDSSKEANAIDQELFRRNAYVEEKLKIVLDYKVVEQKSSDTTTFDTAVKTFLTGNGDIDIITSYAYFVPNLAIAGCFKNLNDINMLDMTSIAWNANFAEAVAYDGALYFNVGDFSLDYLQQIVGIFFNKKLATDHFGSPDVLYDMVEDGTWTIDNVMTMLTDIYDDKNQNGQRDLEDLYGFTLGATSGPCEAFVTGLGFNYTVKNADGEYEMFEMSTGLSDMIDKIHLFLNSDYCAPRSIWSWANGKTSFSAQNTIFLSSSLETLTSNYSDVDFDIGFLPSFKYRETDGYKTAAGDSFSMQSIMANCKDPERAGAVLQCLNEVSYQDLTPAYFDVLLKVRLANDPRDAEMLQLMRDTVQLDFGRIYSAQLNRITGNVWSNFVNGNADYISWYRNHMETVRTKLDNLLLVLRGEKVG